LKNGDIESLKLTSFKDYLEYFDEEIQRKLKNYFPETSMSIDFIRRLVNEETLYRSNLLSPNSAGLNLCIFSLDEAIRSASIA
jgi:hypothetical protein